MDIEEVRDRKAWNELLLSQPGQAGIFLQSFEWGEFQKAVGRNVYRFVNSSQSTVHSFAQVIELSLPMGKKYWFIPRGVMIDGLEKEAREHGALFVRFEPLHGTPPHGAVNTKPISPPQTLLVDLTKSEDEILAGMHEKTRYNVRLGLRKGVVVREGTFGEFWKMMEETAKRDKFHTYPRGYYEKMLTINGAMRTKLWTVYAGTIPLAAAIVGYFGDTATYLHGASSHEHRALKGPHALQWQIMQDAKKSGYRVYDVWGVSTRGGNWAGITRFKMGFGGDVVTYPGTFDLPLSKFWYTVYRLARRVL